MRIKIYGISKQSIVDGAGFRYAVFTQGCRHFCKGCHNPESWDENAGKWMDTDEIFADFVKNPLLKGVTFSGGEPFLQPKPLIELAKLVKSKNKDVTIFTGYTYEELMEMQNEDIKTLLDLTDILIDGKFILEQKNLLLSFRGSENQRVIDMNETRKNGKLIIYNS